MGLVTLLIGLVVFLGVHAFVSMRSRRASLIARFGEGMYKVLFSLLSVVGLILIGVGFARYRAYGWIDIWYPPTWTRHLAIALMWPAVVLVVAAYIPGWIKRKT